MAQEAVMTDSNGRDDEAETPEAAPEPTPVQVEPSKVQVNNAGLVWRDVMVRMPVVATADDLRNPRIWKRVQQQPARALLQHDHLYVLGYDQSWAASAIVKQASNSEAHLVILKVFGFAEVGEGHYSDGQHEVYWDGMGYGVRRCSDKLPVVPDSFSSEGLAIDALRKLYPTQMRSWQ